MFNAAAHRPLTDVNGYAIHALTLSRILQDYARRGIAPDQTHELPAGILRIWIVDRLHLASLQIGDMTIYAPGPMCNLNTPEMIAAALLGTPSQQSDMAAVVDL